MNLAGSACKFGHPGELAGRLAEERAIDRAALRQDLGAPDQSEQEAIREAVGPLRLRQVGH